MLTSTHLFLWIASVTFGRERIIHRASVLRRRHARPWGSLAFEFSASSEPVCDSQDLSHARFPDSEPRIFFIFRLSFFDTSVLFNVNDVVRPRVISASYRNDHPCVVVITRPASYGGAKPIPKCSSGIGVR